MPLKRVSIGETEGTGEYMENGDFSFLRYDYDTIHLNLIEWWTFDGLKVRYPLRA